MPQIGWLINNGNLLLPVLEAGCLRLGYLRSLEGLLLLGGKLLVSSPGGRVKGALGIFYKALISFMRAPPA